MRTLFILLGLGEKHGAAAIRWMLQNVNAEYIVHEGGREMPVRGFEGSRQTVFPHGLGKRRAYRFNFPDQMVLPRTLGVASVSTWMAFDSALITEVFALGKKVGLLFLLRWQPVEDATVKLLQAFQFGAKRYIIQAVARGLRRGKPAAVTVTVSGEHEGRATGLVAAEVARRLHGDASPAGVFHIKQVFKPLSIISELESQGLTFIQTEAADAGL